LRIFEILAFLPAQAGLPVQAGARDSSPTAQNDSYAVNLQLRFQHIFNILD